MSANLPSEALLRASQANLEQSDSRPPLSEQAYRIIRDRILRGTTVAGEKLTIDVLQRDLEISSSPLREALNRLVAENLVVSDERRGFRAAPVTVKDLTDLTAMRVVVEPGALAASMKAGSDAWESQVVAAFYRLDRIERRINAGQMSRDDEWTSRHKEFHLSLISASGSERLVTLCARLFDQSERYRRLSASFRHKPRNTASEHKKLMEAALSRDPKAVSLLRKHIELTTKHVASALNRLQA
jgi:GntR family carbon starvation induced transcriptional regulator